MNVRTSRAHVALAFLASAFVAAGCAGGGSSAIPQSSAMSQPGALQQAARTPHTVTTSSPPAGGTAPTCPQGYDCGYRAIQSLAFDGANFTEVQSNWACFPNLWQLPIYTATTSGPLVLPSAAVTLPSTCSKLPFAKGGDVLRPFTTTTPTPAPTATPTTTPSTSPSPNPGSGQLYIVTYRVGWDDHDRMRKGAKVMHPNCDNQWGAFTIAGPANLTDNPWNFAVIPDSLNLQAGQHYVFFVAEWVQKQHHQGWW